MFFFYTVIHYLLYAMWASKLQYVPLSPLPCRLHSGCLCQTISCPRNFPPLLVVGASFQLIQLIQLIHPQESQLLPVSPCLSSLVVLQILFCAFVPSPRCVSDVLGFCLFCVCIVCPLSKPSWWKEVTWKLLVIPLIIFLIYNVVILIFQNCIFTLLLCSVHMSSAAHPGRGIPLCCSSLKCLQYFLKTFYLYFSCRV